jgi:hypothetical protein
MPSSVAASSASDDLQQRKIQELRVADQELHSGDQSGRVFIQLSRSAVAFQTDRSIAEARVSRQLHQAVEESEKSDKPSDNRSAVNRC